MKGVGLTKAKAWLHITDCFDRMAWLGAICCGDVHFPPRSNFLHLFPDPIAWHTAVSEDVTMESSVFAHPFFAMVRNKEVEEGAVCPAPLDVDEQAAAEAPAHLFQGIVDEVFFYRHLQTTIEGEVKAEEGAVT